ncbi:hypothetical protein [Hyalangium rubrum]|uniref:Uncharacterized protein n=1 Tax=Hyalangium rubrum TaxID=3103134 RepID=A0ABU5GXP7_9BACT|nr:hypothetical protein [Hyalangium sp. s54d21]MDY7225866.1 hypothetical protein [Hyalangium sp. s54d21]
MEAATLIHSQPMTLEEVRVTVRQLLAQENINQHRIGELYNYVVANNLAEGAGYSDALEYFAKNIAELSRATLVRYGSVAREFSAETCARYGTTNLSVLLTYEEVSKLKVDKRDPGQSPIQVPDKDGRVQTKAFALCSVDELRKALQRLRKPTSSAPIPPEEEANVQRYRDALSHHFGKQTRVAVVARNHKGTVLLSLKDIPLDQMEKLAEAVLAGLPLTQPMA